jgi:NTP pyrophosphatase (non-canonical NTP hydrolase)
MDSMKETQSFGMTEFEVMQWAEARGIYENGTALGQAKKTLEEAGELLAAVAANDRKEIADAIGDVVVTLVNVAVLTDMDVRQCFYNAYKVIEPRKGYMNKNGQFVKEQS